MYLFNKIPDNFFSILSSKNKNVYGLALITLYDALELYHNKIRKSDYIDLLKKKGEQEISLLDVEQEDIDDFSLVDSTSINFKTGLVLKRLVDTGWIYLDLDLKTGAEYILLPSYTISMLKIIYEFANENESRYQSYVHSTYADLEASDEAQDDYMYRSLINAYNSTKNLEFEVNSLSHSIRVFHKQLANIFSPNEVLSQHFDIAREDVVDPIYHPLKTNDSITLYSKPINSILKRWLNNEIVREKLIDQALIYNKKVKTREDGLNDVISRINFISDTYDRLSREMDDIDIAQSEYTVASTQKVIYLNNQDKSIKGKLETIFLALAKSINNEVDGEVFKQVIKDVTHSITLYQQGYIDSDSLAKPYRRSSRFEGDPLSLDDTEHEIDEGLMNSLLNIMDQYSDEKIMDFMDNAFKDQESINVHDIKVKDVEDFIMVILSSVKANDDQAFYTLEREEPLQRSIQDKFDMPDYKFNKKGE